MLSKSEILLRIYARLKQSPCTVDILKDWRDKNGFQFSDRSLYRYMNELELNLNSAGEKVECQANENNKKTWKLVFDNSVKGFSIFDINTLYLAKHFVPQSIIKHRKESFDKIEKLVYAQQSKDKFEYTADANNLAFSNTNFYDIIYTQKQQQQIEELIWAIQKRQKIILQQLHADLAIFYKSDGIKNTICPMAFKYHRGVLHLCSFNETTNNVLIIPLDTLSDFTLLEKHFNIQKYKKQMELYFDKHFGITENINNKTYSIEIEFTEGTGKFVQQFFWHNSQHFSTLKDGNILLRLNCGINRELVGWIFQWMSNIKVRKPQMLQQIVIDKYKDCLEIHTTNKNFKSNNSFTKQK